jgi:hypothetical protein
MEQHIAGMAGSKCQDDFSAVKETPLQLKAF